MTRPADYQQRLAALDPTGSFAVSAPAGSGKTGLLTQRVLTLLASCEQPEEVLSITFTRKAAAEMRHRIINALRGAQSPTPPESEYEQHTWQLAREVLQRDSQLNWQLLSAPNRLRIQTIDGLCRDLARQLVLENGLGELPQPTDNAGAYYREAVQKLFTELEKGGETAAALGTLLRHLDNNMQRLENLLAGLLARREQWLGAIVSARDARPYLEQQLQQTICETLQAATDKLQPFASDLALLVDYAATNLSENIPDHPLCQLQGVTELPGTDCEDSHPWQAVLELLLVKDERNPGFRKRIDKNSGFPAGKGEAKARKEQLLELIEKLREVPGLLQALLDIRNLPYSRYPRQQWCVLQALTTLLPVLCARLSLLFLANNDCDFTEVTLAALRALGDEDNPTDTALRLDYLIRHILIDEFQDTSSNQFQLLRKLTAGWQPDDGRTLFIVGDGMQSLYGFRSANVGLFLEARRHPIGDIVLQPLDLTVNFRSQAKVVQWVNQHFKTAFPAEDNINRGAVHYSNADAFNPPLPGDAVTVDAILDAPDRSREAQLVVEKILAARQQQADSTVAVLVRNRTHLREILPALYEAGLNWQAIDIEPLSHRMAVMDIHSLTRALLSFADRIAWLAVLRAPWCGLSLEDLHCLANAELPDHNPIAQQQHYPLLWGQLQHCASIDRLSADGRIILQRVVKVLSEGFQERGRKPLRSWIEGIWIALGGPSALLDGNDLQHVRRYFDLLEQHSNSGHIEDWQAFTQAVDNLYAAPSDDSDPRLQLMTIHKSKGLEFDTVIIPGLDRSSPGNDSEILRWHERIDRNGQPQLLLGSLQASGDRPDALFEHLKREAKEKTQLENTRVIYVASTRSINKLHLLFNVKSNNEDNFKTPPVGSLLAPLWRALEPQLKTAANGYNLHYPDSTEQEQGAPSTPTLSHFVRLPANWQAQAATPAAKSEQLLAAYRGRTEGYEQNQTGHDDPNARHTGTLLHRTLQQIVTDGFEHWGAERIKQQQPFWRAQLRQLGIGQDIEQSINKLSQAVQRTCEDKKGQWILDNKHRQSRCEMPLCYFSGSGHKQRKAVIDRTFVADGVRWIIDYKSSQPTDGQTLQAFLAEQREHYRPQLKRYGDLFARMEQLPVRLALYFPLIAHFEELEHRDT